jgi:hypothetical protein
MSLGSPRTKRRSRLVWILLAALVGLTPASAGSAAHDALRTPSLEWIPLLRLGRGPAPTQVRGWLGYRPSGPTFRFGLLAFGLTPRGEHELVYVPAPWSGEGLRCLGRARTGRRGTLWMHRSLELDMDLPAPFDANHPEGAELRLVPARDVDCEGGRLRRFRPRHVLFGGRLVRYVDTDRLPDLDGPWCVIAESPGRTNALEMRLARTGDLVEVEVEGLVATGVLTGNILDLTVDVPGEGEATVSLRFDADGETAAGTLVVGGEVSVLSGRRGACIDHPFPAGDPVCSLPVAEPGLVTGGQQFNSETGGVVHNGLDFRLETPLPVIVAPCDGVVTELSRGEIAEGNLIWSLVIRYNDDWNVLLAFEPYSPDPAIAELQRGEIDVEVNDVVTRGDPIGRLLVPDPVTAFPHLHWSVLQRDPEQTAECPRDFLVPEDQALLDALYGTFGLLPACLPGVP